MKNKFGLGVMLGMAAIIGLGAQQAGKLIHQYPARVTLLDTDLFLLDTLTEYRSASWLKIATAFTNTAARQALIATNGLKTYVDGSTNLVGANVYASAKDYTDVQVTAKGNANQQYTDDATNQLRIYIDLSTNSLGVGLRSYTDSKEVAVIPGVNTTVATNLTDRTFQVNVTPVGGGSATNIVWPVAGTNVTMITNGLELTVNADVSKAVVAAKASTNELIAATNNILSVATARITAATNTLWGWTDTNGLATGLRSYTDAATNVVLSTATSRITSATNGAYVSATAYATAATNSVLATATARIVASTNTIAAATLTGTIALARLSGITSNQLDSATDAAYRAGGGDVTTAQLVDATNSTLTVATARITSATNTLWGLVNTNGLGSGLRTYTDNATNGLWTAVDARVVGATNGLKTYVDSRVVGATNGLWILVDTNGLGTGLRAYSDTFAVVGGINTTVSTNGHVFQVSATGGGGGGSATNVVWPTAGANVTASTNGLVVTINADVSLASVAAKASTNQLISATNLSRIYTDAATNDALATATTRTTAATNTLWGLVNTNGLGTGLRAYTDAATNSVLATATARTTAATNTLWLMTDTNGLANGLKIYTGVATNSVWNAVNTNGLGNGLRAHTDNATNQVLATATSRIDAATNGILNNPTFVGGFNVTGGSGTNDWYGINNITNVNGLRVRWITNQILSPGPVTNTIIYLGFQ